MSEENRERIVMMELRLRQLEEVVYGKAQEKPPETKEVKVAAPKD